MDYKGIDDPHGVSLCPVVVKPRHAVLELPVSDDEHLHETRRSRRAIWGRIAHGRFVSSQTLVRGWLSTAALGGLSLAPLIARVLAPRRFARLRASLNKSFLPEPRTELTLMRMDEKGHEAAEGLMLGFWIQEKIERVESVLGPGGLRSGFARLVILLGHGSTSLNNPHESAHDCGACGGRRGGPNGRLFAAMANIPQVRDGLRAKGIDIPPDTWFVGGYHDTCNDDVDLFDLEQVPATHAEDLASASGSLDRARAWNAHERSRRFEAANPDESAGLALLHVEERSEHLAEPRPEYGHCTNAVCIVGRRHVTRGLFLDRRAFLVSYDADQDPEDTDLGRLLAAAVPVCAGISLEYYFSFVDNERYGCGTKLPHNVTGLLGVMNGHASDLRTGLPWQMVEIHEPVRILFVVETTPDRVMGAISKHPAMLQLLVNRWIRMATLDHRTGEMHAYRDGSFEAVDPMETPLPVVATSAAWYRGKIEHLPAVAVAAGL
ncbi:MAG: putative inorganic carbon transporter subunit DabA [Bryobacteraceae bacterium]